MIRILAALLALTVAPFSALADPALPLTYNIVNAPRGDGNEVPFNVTDWTEIGSLPGAACYTCNMEYLVYNDSSLDPVAYAYFQTAITGGQVRLKSFYYDTSGRQDDVSWGTNTHPGGGGLPLQTINIASKFNTYMRANGHAGVAFTIEVKGVGSVYMTRMYTGWRYH